MSASDVTRMMHSRGAVVVAALIAVAATLPAFYNGTAQPSAIGTALLLNGCIATVFIYLNRHFNLSRSMTMLNGMMFLLMETATPQLLTEPNNGLVLALVVGVCLVLTMGTYSNLDAQRQVFLVFLLLSAGIYLEPAFVVYIPVFLLGCVQMRIFSLRTLMAFIMGILTPWIILIGLGVTDFDALSPSRLDFITPDNYEYSVVFTAFLTGFIAITAWLQNLIKVLTYNAHSRAMISLATVTMIVTIAAGASGLCGLITYLPLLNACAGLQLAHLFGNIHNEAKSYIAILTIALIYILLYTWQIIAPAILTY